MSLRLIYIILAILGVCFTVYGILLGKKKRVNSLLTSLNRSKDTYKGILDSILDKIPFVVKEEERLDKKLLVISDRLNGRSLTKFRLIGLIIAIAISIYLKNFLVFFPLAFLFCNIPISLFEIKINKRISKFESQFLDALNIFTTEYTTIKSVRRALTNTCSQLKSPLKEEFERLDRELNSGEPIEKCFMDFANRTHNRWSLVFSQLMITYFRIGGNITEHIMNITKRINTEKIENEQNHTELSSMRTVNILLNCLVPVVYVAGKIINPEDSLVFVETQVGQVIIFGISCACILSLWMGKKIVQM